LAEELDVDWKRVRAEAAPPSDKLYGNPFFGFQFTGNSNSIRAFWKSLRKAGASARAMLVQAAANRWKVEPSTCSTKNGEVIHTQSGRKFAFGQLVGDAAAVTPPTDPPLKSAASFSIIGKSLKRLDTGEKVNGKAKYGIDALPAGV